MTQASDKDRPDFAQGARPETVLDPSTQRIARVYAEALFRAADRRNQIDDLQQELDSLVTDIFQADPLIEVYLTSPAVNRNRKQELIRAAFETRSSELFLNALLVLKDHERLDLLRSIVSEYRALRDERGGLVRVVVRTPVPLADDQRERLNQELQQTLGKSPRIETQVDPDLLGGMVIRVGDLLYDYSVRTRLDEIRNHLIARSSHEIQSRRDRFCTANGD